MIGMKPLQGLILFLGCAVSVFPEAERIQYTQVLKSEAIVEDGDVFGDFRLEVTTEFISASQGSSTYKILLLIHHLPSQSSYEYLFFGGPVRQALTGHDVIVSDIENILFLELSTIPAIEAGPLSNTLSHFIIDLNRDIPGIALLSDFYYGHETDYEETLYHYPQGLGDIIIVEHINIIPYERNKPYHYNIDDYLYQVDLGQDMVTVDRLDNGLVKEEDLRIRSEPSLESEILGIHPQGSKVFIKGVSSEKMRVGRHYSPWYEVYNPVLQIWGWSYGAFVTPLSNLEQYQHD